MTWDPTTAGLVGSLLYGVSSVVEWYLLALLPLLPAAGILPQASITERQ